MGRAETAAPHPVGGPAAPEIPEALDKRSGRRFDVDVGVANGLSDEVVGSAECARTRTDGGLLTNRQSSLRDAARAGLFGLPPGARKRIGTG